MRSEVAGFQAVLGAHDGQNLGRYLVGMFDRLGIMGPKQSKVNKLIDLWLITTHSIQLFAVTLDNASVNTSICKVIQAVHERRELEEWEAVKQQLPYVHSLLTLSVLIHMISGASVTS